MEYKNAQVLKYSFRELRNLFAWAALSHDSLHNVKRDSFAASLSEANLPLYLHGYLKEFCREENFHAKTIIVETNYIDRDFMTEYSGFHSSTFQDFPKRTTRLHFFSDALSKKQFDAIVLAKNGAAEINKHYLGFIVVRPTMRQFVGRTCLKHYPARKTGKLSYESEPETQIALFEHRNYPVSNRYSVNLFGLELYVDSVAFHEQDSIVGVCATAALYALFHGTQRLLRNRAYSGLEITRLANNSLSSIPFTLGGGEVSRSMPNTGLNIEQMYRVVTDAGLAPMVIGAGLDAHGLRKTLAALYAYLSLGLPVLALVKFGVKGTDLDTIKASIGHAFTITGFSLARTIDAELLNSATAGETSEPPTLLGMQINKFYVHDDNIGPFSKFLANYHCLDADTKVMALDPDAIKKRGSRRSKAEVIDPYRAVLKNALGGGASKIYAYPVTYLIPTSDKLRLDFASSLKVLNLLNPGLLRGPGSVDSDEMGKFFWDAKFATVNQIKTSWRAMDLPDKDRSAYLEYDLPRFSLRLICMQAASKPTAHFEILLDATATDVSDAMLAVVPHSPNGFKTLCKLRDLLTHSEQKKDIVEQAIVFKFLDFFQ